MRLGLFGGTFDPVHWGHVRIAQSAADRLNLDEVWFLPAGQPWMRRGTQVASRGARRAMVELAALTDPRFRVCSLELDRPGNTYTVDTLEVLAAIRPGDELILVVGSDALARFIEWKQPGRILSLATVAVADRPGYSVDVDALRRNLGGGERIIVIETPLVPISGTEVRRRVAAGERIDCLVPEAVAAYVARHALYQAKSECTAGCEGR